MTTVTIDASQTTSTTTGESETPAAPLEFESWIAEQPEPVKALLDGHTKGLKSALETERNSRKELEKTLREMAGKAEKGSETQAQLTQMADQLKAEQTRANFFEAAHAAGRTGFVVADDVDVTARRDAQLDVMADLLAAHLDVGAMLDLLEHGAPARPTMRTTLA